LAKGAIVTQTATKTQAEPVTPAEPELVYEESAAAIRERQAEMLRLLWSRRRLLLRAFVAAVLASTLVAFLIPKSYTSTAQLMPPAESSSGLAMLATMATAKAGPYAGMAGDLLGLKSSGALFIGILRSETARDRIIHDFNLQKVYGTRLLADAREKLDQNTTISEDRKSGILTISVTDHDPKRAAAIANAYVDQLNLLVAQLSTSAARREREFLEERLKVAKAELDNATQALAQFSSKNNTLDIETEGRAMLDAAGTLGGQLIAAQAQLEGLRQIYTDNNPRVKALTAHVAELRKQLEKLGGVDEASSAARRPAQGAPRAAAAEPDTVASGKLGALPFPTIRNLPLLGAKYADYYRAAKIQETVFEMLTGQYELAKVQEAKETPSVKVLDPGEVPEKKSFPSRLLIIFLGTFFGMAGCILVILAQHRWESTEASDPRKVLAQEVLASVKARLPWATVNGSGSPTKAQKLWSRMNGRRPPSNGASAE
jgi:uncharacterized protein involved in exopolysaccharide biosynthesis